MPNIAFRYFLFAFSVFFFLGSMHLNAQDSAVHGEIKVIKPKQSVPESLIDTVPATVNHDRIERHHHRQVGEKYRILISGFFTGLDYSNFWSYRLGFFYSSKRVCTAVAFRHAWTTGFSGAVFSLQFPLGSETNWRYLQPGVEWTSMGKTKFRYHSINTFLAFLVPSKMIPDMQIRAGYNFNPNRKSIENGATNSLLAGVYFHF